MKKRIVSLDKRSTWVVRRPRSGQISGLVIRSPQWYVACYVGVLWIPRHPVTCLGYVTKRQNQLGNISQNFITCRQITALCNFSPNSVHSIIRDLCHLVIPCQQWKESTVLIPDPPYWWGMNSGITTQMSNSCMWFENVTWVSAVQGCIPGCQNETSASPGTPTFHLNTFTLPFHKTVDYTGKSTLRFIGNRWQASHHS